jgi:hypothetical protein
MALSETHLLALTPHELHKDITANTEMTFKSMEN